TANIDQAVISDEARFVAFKTTATNLAAGVTAPMGGIYLRDRVTGVTRYISRNPATGTVSDTFSNFLQAISPDGRYVAFLSRSANLVNGVTTNGASQLYLYDRVADTLRMVTANAAGTAAVTPVFQNDEDFQAQFSADGRTLIFAHTAGDLVPGVTDANNA